MARVVWTTFALTPCVWKRPEGRCRGTRRLDDICLHTLYLEEICLDTLRP